ncbi:hypothetical protein NC651_034833 [Populus alba x Populus x berolinensis]|nr:hypothetical protein NC651_034833 [Populus alba x Populus x berolinensis]
MVLDAPHHYLMIASMFSPSSPCPITDLLRISDGTQNLEVRLWTSRLVEYFADDINKQVGNGVDGRKFPKAMA